MPAQTTELLRAQSALVLADLAEELGCEPADFAAGKLIVVVRPEGAREPFVARAATAGLGTVVSAEASLVAWVREHAPPDRHFRALQPFFLAELAAEARRRDWPRATAYGFHLGFALAERTPRPVGPPSLSLIAVDTEWMARYRESRVFDNALGERGEDWMPGAWHGYALLDQSGEPVAIAGIWQQGARRDEIGVDVRRDYRGQGLAPVVVLAAVHDILGRGRTPFYSISATNIRSHRNALACGFLPALIEGTVAEIRSEG